MTDDSLEHFAQDKLARLDADLLRREIHVTDRTGPALGVHDGKELQSFACNDYLGLSHHPDVVEASIKATAELGAGAGASRLVTGNHSLYTDLEARLAAIKGTEAAVVFGSGYLANLGTIPALVGPQDLILIDELCHACLHSGATLARSTVIGFRHNDVAHAVELLDAHRGKHPHCLVLTEGIFSMDGDRAPVAALLDLAQRHDAWLMTDDAHGLGVIGGGRGSSISADGPLRVPLQMGTLSKAVGAYGGYVCASRSVVDLLHNRARSFVYSTGLPPGTVAAAAKSLEIIARDRELTAKPLRLARRFTAALGLPEAESPIVPIMLGTAARALRASEKLAEAGFLVVGIRPPTVPEGTARLRCTFSAVHGDEDVDRFAAAMRKTLASL
ncbi:MAG TPA: aminotransferase class I/II-fold pyridoxal phosphate-dependent enzyme [Gammaproteobacteria bacterium]